MYFRCQNSQSLITYGLVFNDIYKDKNILPIPVTVTCDNIGKILKLLEEKYHRKF